VIVGQEEVLDQILISLLSAASDVGAASGRRELDALEQQA